MHHHTEQILNLLGGGSLRFRHEMGVAPRHDRASVAEQLGQRHFAVSLLGKVAGKGMPEAVEDQTILVLHGMIVQAKLLDNRTKSATGSWADIARVVRENEFLGVILGELQPLLKGFPHGLRHGGIPAAPIFGPADKEGSIVKIDVIELKPCDFSKPQTALQGYERHEPFPVAFFPESGEHPMQIVFGKVARPLVVNHRHGKIDKGQRPTPHLPFYGPVHHAADETEQTVNRLRGESFRQLRPHKIIQMVGSDPVERALAEFQRLNMVFIVAGVIIQPTLSIRLQPSRSGI